MPEEPKGWIIIRVEEATGKNKRGEYMWDTLDLEGYVKVEIRGGSEKVKVATVPVRVEGTNIYWNQLLIMEVREGADELRLILCRKERNESSSSSVIAACGIYMTDILEAVPIDKYFELFKPGRGGDGGQIRVAMNYSPGPKKPNPSSLGPNLSPSQQSPGQSGSQDVSDLAMRHAQEMEDDDDDDEEDGPRLNPVVLGGAVAGISLVAGLLVALLRKK